MIYENFKNQKKPNVKSWSAKEFKNVFFLNSMIFSKLKKQKEKKKNDM